MVENTVEPDGLCARKIHQVFTRALKKFKTDLYLWIEYIQYCIRCDSAKVLSRVFAEASMYHPLELNLWIMTATWEMEDHSNMPAVRVLLKRALRLIPENESLWIAYFKLELLYWDKLNKRKEIMLSPSISTIGIESDDSCVLVVELEEEKNRAQFPIQISTDILDTENILYVIFDHAISCCATANLEFCEQILQVFDAANIYPLKAYDYIVQQIQSKFSSAKHEIIAFLLEREWKCNKSHENFISTVDKLSKSISEFKSSALLLHLIDFIRNNTSCCPPERVNVLLFDSFQLAEKFEIFDSELLFVEWIEFLISQGTIKDALTVSNYSLTSIRSSSKLRGIANKPFG